MLQQNFSRDEVRMLMFHALAGTIEIYDRHKRGRDFAETAAREKVDRIFPEDEEIFCGYTLEQLQTLVVSSNEIEEADVKAARRANIKKFTPSPNPGQDTLISIGIWDEDGCFVDFDETTVSPVVKKLSDWYEETYC